MYLLLPLPLLLSPLAAFAITSLENGGYVTGNIGPLSNMIQLCNQSISTKTCGLLRPLALTEGEDFSVFYNYAPPILDTFGVEIAVTWDELRNESSILALYSAPYWSGMNSSGSASPYMCENWTSNVSCAGGAVGWQTFGNYIADCSEPHLLLCVCAGVTFEPTSSPSTSVPSAAPATSVPTNNPTHKPTSHSPTSAAPTASPVRSLMGFNALGGVNVVTAGPYQTCVGLLNLNEVVCFGKDDYSQTYGIDEWNFNSGGVVMGQMYACVYGGSGIACWGTETGYDGFNDDTFVSQVYTINPFTYGIPGTIAKVALGSNFGCATITGPTDNFYCFGNNNDADGFTIGIAPYGQVNPGSFGIAAHTNDLCAGLDHVCVLLLFVNDGPGLAGTQIQCSGSRQYRQIGVLGSSLFTCGDGDGGGMATYQNLCIAYAEDLINVACGAYHTCYLQESGYVLCWGRNDYGQSSGYSGTDPGPWAPFISISAVAVWAGGFNTCVMDASNQVYCIGDNTYGQLGIGSVGGISYGPTLLNGLGSRVPKSMTFGFQHVCLLDTNNKVSCWGGNTYGQLGIETEVSVYEPSLLQG